MAAAMGETQEMPGSHSAIDHSRRSFEGHDPVDMLQYWIASRRSLGQALIENTLAACRRRRRSHDHCRPP